MPGRGVTPPAGTAQNDAAGCPITCIPEPRAPGIPDRRIWSGAALPDERSGMSLERAHRSAVLGQGRAPRRVRSAQRNATSGRLSMTRWHRRVHDLVPVVGESCCLG